MARGKFNKRGAGPRLDAVNMEEIEIRNARLAELEEERAQRRADDGDDDDDDEGEDEKGDKKKKKKAPAAADSSKGGADDDDTAKAENKGASSSKQGSLEPEAKAPVQVTTEFEHKRNLAKLEAVRKRREAAEAQRKLAEEAEKEQEEERKKLMASHQHEMESDTKTKKKSKEEEIPKLDKVAIKRMKPAQMKDALKVRGLDIQGNAKTLQDRLLKYEEAR